MNRNFQLEVVSGEAEIFSGLVQKLFVSGEMGDMEVLFNHAPLLTSLKSGPAWILKQDNQEEILYISGGMLIIRPKHVTILADTAIRAAEVDEAHALEAKKRAEQIVRENPKDFKYMQAESQLLETVAQLKDLKKFRERYYK